MFCQIDWSRFDRIATYHPTPEELAQPAEPIITAPIWEVPVTYHTLTVAGRVAIAKYDEPIKVRWIAGTKTDRRIERERVKMLVR